MQGWVLFARILAGLAVIGVLAGSLAAPASAPAAAAAAMSDMADGMTCCPSDSPAPECPKGCALAAGCASSCLPGWLTAPFGSVQLDGCAALRPGSDIGRGPLAAAPMPKPPRL